MGAIQDQVQEQVASQVPVLAVDKPKQTLVYNISHNGLFINCWYPRILCIFRLPSVESKSLNVADLFRKGQTNLSLITFRPTSPGTHVYARFDDVKRGYSPMLFLARPRDHMLLLATNGTSGHRAVILNSCVEEALLLQTRGAGPLSETRNHLEGSREVTQYSKTTTVTPQMA